MPVNNRFTITLGKRKLKFIVLYITCKLPTRTNSSSQVFWQFSFIILIRERVQFTQTYIDLMLLPACWQIFARTHTQLHTHTFNVGRVRKKSDVENQHHRRPVVGEFSNIRRSINAVDFDGCKKAL